MLRRLSMLMGCALLASMAAVTAPAHAAGNWYFMNFCAVPTFCWNGTDVITWGPFPTEADCNAFRAAYDQSWAGAYPRQSTMCWEE